MKLGALSLERDFSTDDGLVGISVDLIEIH